MALGLILSSSDIKVLNTTGVSPPSRWEGGEYGAALLNSTLSSPLTSSGDFARQFSTTSECFGGYYVSSSVDSSVYAGTSITTSKAYSMRAWVRVKNNNKADTQAVGLSFMGQTNVLRENGDIRLMALGGYSLQFSSMHQANNHGSDQFSPYLWIGTMQVSGTNNGSFPPVACSGGTGGAPEKYSEDEWHRIRFDMVPVGSAGVTLNAYTSSAGDVQSGQEVWEQVGTVFVQSTDAVYIDPLTTNGMGYYAWQDEGAHSTDVGYIDQFEILVEDL